jgi:Kdo2-lipid IVA lauroyltransferase/acyltransferase
MRPSLPIRVAVATAKALPRFVVFFAARIMGWIGYIVNRASRERAMDNVRTCFPKKSKREHRRIAVKGFQHMALVAMDAMRAPEERSGMMRYINVRNLHYVTDCLRKGRGVVLVTGHFGNVAVLPVAFDRLCDEPAYIMRRPQRKVSWVIRAARAYRDEYLKPRSTFRSLDSSTRDAIELEHLLKRGNIVIVLADLTWESGTVPVEMFGTPYLMSRLPASLAIINGVSLVPVVTIRRASGNYDVFCEPPIEKPEVEDHEAKRTMTLSFARVLERFVASSPEQWCWTHRQAWRSKRSG